MSDRSIQPGRRRLAVYAAATFMVAAGVAAVLAPASPAFAATCSQPSHAWLPIGLSGQALSEGGGVQTTDTSVNLYPTGVVQPGTLMTFTFRARKDFKVIRQQVTGAADSSCIVHHQGEEFSAGRLGTRALTVDVTYTRWEDNSTVTLRLGELDVNPGGSETDVYPGPCSQPSKVWVAFVGSGGALTEGAGRVNASLSTTLAMTGIVSRFTFSQPRFDFVSRDSGGTVLTHTTAAPDSNCVVHDDHERVSASVLGVGSFDVWASYFRAETNEPVTVNLGILVIS
jgi:hypothetical protein